MTEERKHYEAPCLERFGSIAQLTAGGSLGRPEFVYATTIAGEQRP